MLSARRVLCLAPRHCPSTVATVFLANRRFDLDVWSLPRSLIVIISILRSCALLYALV